jgi:hypothetical protein
MSQLKGMPVRVKLEVEVDLDPFPGTFHTEESARATVEIILNQRINHYNPTVSIKDK